MIDQLAAYDAGSHDFGQGWTAALQELRQLLTVGVRGSDLPA